MRILRFNRRGATNYRVGQKEAGAGWEKHACSKARPAGPREKEPLEWKSHGAGRVTEAGGRLREENGPKKKNFYGTFGKGQCSGGGKMDGDLPALGGARVKFLFSRRHKVSRGGGKRGPPTNGPETPSKGRGAAPSEKSGDSGKNPMKRKRTYRVPPHRNLKSPSTGPGGPGKF